MKEKNLEICVLLDYYGELLGENRREAVDLYYNEDLSLSEIAQHLDISRQGVRDLIKHGEKALAEYEQKLHLLKKNAAMREVVQKIIELSGDGEAKRLACGLLDKYL